MAHKVESHLCDRTAREFDSRNVDGSEILCQPRTRCVTIVIGGIEIHTGGEHHIHKLCAPLRSDEARRAIAGGDIRSSG
jgi:hypothetical protein